MAATISTMAMLNPKCWDINSSNKYKLLKLSKTETSKSIPLLTLENHPKGLIASELSSSRKGTGNEGGLQLNRIRNSTEVILGLGFGGLIASSSFFIPSASAIELATIAEASTSTDNRGSLLLFVLAPAVVWVLYNILQPALNQLNRMRSK